MLTISPPPPGARPPKDWRRRSSPLARYALFAYALIVVDASLFPFRGWRDLGLGPLDYLVADWPRHALPFDLFVNALGYAPLGFLAVLALHPRVRGLAAVVLALLVCGLASGALEALQTYLPARVASKVDLLANLCGACVGAVVAARFAGALLDTGRLRVWRARWFAGDASRGLVLSAVWFGALVYPDVFAFGTGGLLQVFDPEASSHIGARLGFGDTGDAVLSALHFQRAEAAVTALSLIGAGSLFLNLFRVGVRWYLRIALLVFYVAMTVAVETIVHTFLFDAAPDWPPLTPGSRFGVAVAMALLLVATFVPARLRWAVGLVALIASVTLVNVYPENPYVNPVGLAWTRGRLMNFYGLASGLNLVWPWLAIVYLLRHPAPAAGPRKRSPFRADRMRRSL